MVYVLKIMKILSIRARTRSIIVFCAADTSIQSAARAFRRALRKFAPKEMQQWRPKVPKSSQNEAKMHPQSTEISPNPSKIGPKSDQNHSKCDFGWFWGSRGAGSAKGRAGSFWLLLIVAPFGPKCRPKGEFWDPWKRRMVPKTDLPRLDGHFGRQKVFFWRVLENHQKTLSNFDWKKWAFGEPKSSQSV